MKKAHKEKPVNVLVVEDSLFASMTIRRILAQDPDIRVIGTARNGVEGIEKLKALKPQVITMDIEMPVMDGLRALEEIMRWQPTPVIVLSAHSTKGAEATLRAFDSGAFEVVAKPSGGAGADLESLSRELTDKIKAAALSDPARLKQSLNNRPCNRSLNKQFPVKAAAVDSAGGFRNGSHSLPEQAVEIVAIGTSTGGPAALQTVLPALPADLPVPVLVAQHMPAGFTAPLAQRLDGICPLPVREAVDGDVLLPGNIYIAPAGKQMQVQRKSGQVVAIINTEAAISTLYRPSVDILFLSLAKEIGSATLAVVMTGMGNDGCKGLKAIRDSGGFAIAEAEDSCIVYGMPRAVIEAGLANRVVTLPEIGKTIVECVMRR
jgi:two-component system chemotaxis response regulator CheB